MFCCRVKWFTHFECYSFCFATAPFDNNRKTLSIVSNIEDLSTSCEGMSAMAKDESITEYIVRLALRMLCNFTAGLFVAVGIFICSLYSLLQSYRTNLIAGLFFFIFASIASISFAMTWILGLYAGAAGTMYVCSRVATNLQIQDRRQQQYGGRVRDY